MNPMRARVTLLVAVVVEVAAAAVLVPMTASSPVPIEQLATWIESVGVAAVLVTVATWVGAALSLWLLAATTCALLAASGRDLARRVATRMAPAVLVRTCAVALSPAIALAPTTAMAIEAPIPPPAETPSSELPAEVPSRHLPAEVPSSESATDEVLEAPRQPSPTSDPSAPSVSPATPPVEQQIPPGLPPNAPPHSADLSAEATVIEGDNLWVMTARHLATVRGVDTCEVPDAEIAEVWRVVVRENRDRLRSGDPDLIFPGETVLLPGG